MTVVLLESIMVEQGIATQVIKAEQIKQNMARGMHL